MGVQDKRDALLGRIAIDRGLITEDQYRECMRDRATLSPDPDQTAGRSDNPRPLGVVLLSKGYIQERDLFALMEEQARREGLIAEFRKLRKVDYLIGQILVKDDHATQNQINKCLEKQMELAKQGVTPTPRLGDLLVEHGYVSKEVVDRVLGAQHSDELICTGCSRHYHVVGLEDGKTYRCKQCGDVMVRRAILDSLKSEEGDVGFPPPPPPPGP